MAYRIDVIKNNTIVFLKYFDEVMAREYELSRNVVADIMNVNSIPRLLISMEEAVLKSTRHEEFLFVRDLSDYFLFRIKIAYLVPPDSPFAGHHEFIEEMALKYDVNLVRFSEYEKAVQWLLRKTRDTVNSTASEQGISAGQASPLILPSA